VEKDEDANELWEKTKRMILDIETFLVFTIKYELSFDSVLQSFTSELSTPVSSRLLVTINTDLGLMHF